MEYSIDAAVRISDKWRPVPVPLLPNSQPTWHTWRDNRAEIPRRWIGERFEERHQLTLLRRRETKRLPQPEVERLEHRFDCRGVAVIARAQSRRDLRRVVVALG